MEADAWLSADLQAELEVLSNDPAPVSTAPGRGAVDNKDEEGKYKFWTRREPAWKQSDVEIDLDNGLPYQWWDVGMTRNAKAENRARTKVYLEPIPHIIKDDQNIPLRGWYQSKFETSPQTRARPCLLPDALVDTPQGSRMIKDIKVGDEVLGYDFDTDQYVVTVAEGTAQQIKDEYLEIELEDGRVLKLTPEHQLFTNNRGWVEAQNLTQEDDILELAPIEMLV